MVGRDQPTSVSRLKLTGTGSTPEIVTMRSVRVIRPVTSMSRCWPPMIASIRTPSRATRNAFSGRPLSDGAFTTSRSPSGRRTLIRASSARSTTHRLPSMSYEGRSTSPSVGIFSASVGRSGSIAPTTMSWSVTAAPLRPSTSTARDSLP